MKVPRLLLWSAAALVLASYAMFLYRSREHVRLGWVDFRSMYTAAWMVRDGAGESLYQVPAQSEAFRRYSPNPMPLWFNHPPFEVPLFLPFTYLTFGRAYVAWLALSVVLVAALAGILARFSLAPSGLSSFAVTVACFTFFPVWYMFHEGQDSIFIALAYTLAYAALVRNRETWAGFLMGLGLYRFHLVLPVIFVFLLLRRWRVLGGFAGACILLGLISLAVVGWEGTLRYPQFLLELNRHDSYGVIVPYHMPNLRGQALTFAAWRIPSVWIDVGVALVSLAVLLWVAGRWKRAEAQHATTSGLLMALTLTVTLVLSYHLNLQDLVVLLLPLSLVAQHLWQTRDRKGPAHRALQMSAAALFLPPVYEIPEWPDRTLVLFCLLVLFAAAIAAEVSAEEKVAVAGELKHEDGIA
ncbi:MAG TPA: glycosyltransferase family 87 protein [Terriglobales bacterium]|nr:glycosyltransferase family 87 protein [Terriglobales bacterium]